MDVPLFADDTNLTPSNCEVSKVQKDLAAINTWLNANKLNLDMKKTAMMNIGKRASNSNFKFTDNDIEIQRVQVSRYPYLQKLSSDQPLVNSVKMRFRKQCCIISKLRHYVPRSQLLTYYFSKIRTFIPYGRLVYGFCSSSSLEPNFFAEKIWNLIFRKRRDSCWDIQDNEVGIFKTIQDLQVLSVFELHIYELLKF